MLGSIVAFWDYYIRWYDVYYCGMARNPKTPQFDTFNLRTNCFGRFQIHDMMLEEWLDDSPIVLEVGAGEAAVALAHAGFHPDQQVIALDQKADRLSKAAKVADAKGLQNIAFVHSDVRELDDVVNLRGRVDTIWVTFADPYPRDRQEKHRLAYGRMLTIYEQLLRSGGQVHFKTDNEELFAYALESFTAHEGLEITWQTFDLHNSDCIDPVALTKTRYEERFTAQGIPTKMLTARRVK